MRSSSDQVSPLDGTELSRMIATSAPEKPAIRISGRRTRGMPATVNAGTAVVVAARVTAVVVVAGSAICFARISSPQRQASEHF